MAQRTRLQILNPLNGYHGVVQIEDSTFIFESQKEEGPWLIYNEEDQNPDFSIFKSLIDQHRQILIENEDLWGALDIDKTLNPNPDDWIVLGTSLKPLKRYHVQNKVEEKSVTEFTYLNGGIKKIVKNDYPFVYKSRSITML